VLHLYFVHNSSEEKKYECELKGFWTLVSFKIGVTYVSLHMLVKQIIPSFSSVLRNYC
jgi:hypothetical protein